MMTSDAIMLAIEDEIPAVLVDRAGRVQGRIWSPRFGSIATIRREQIRFAETSGATAWVVRHLKLKLSHQCELLRMVKAEKPRHTTLIQQTIQALNVAAEAMDALLDKPLSQIEGSLRGIEGPAARRYFTTLGLLLPKRYYFARRSRRPALDPFNALLNYVYGMLYNRVEHSLIIAGLDPYLPLLHADGYRRPAFVYDFIEAYRPWADAVAVRICLDKQLKKSHLQAKDAGLWLSPAGRGLAVETFNNGLLEKVERHRGAVMRQHALQEQATDFAQYLLARGMQLKPDNTLLS
jgi:CRISPR-associated protein Cas1